MLPYLYLHCVNQETVNELLLALLLMKICHHQQPILLGIILFACHFIAIAGQKQQQQQAVSLDFDGTLTRMGYISFPLTAHMGVINAIEAYNLLGYGMVIIT